MPTGSFTYYTVRKFPPSETLKHPRKVGPNPQTAFNVEGMQPHDAPDPIFTEIRYRHGDSLAGYKVFDVEHRQPVHIRGWWNNNWITQIIQDEKFNLYYNPDKQVAITHVRKEVSLSATSALEKWASNQFKFEINSLDFNKIIQGCANLKGAWFAKMQYPGIRSEAAYGDKIQRDPEFQRLLEHGVLQNIIVEIEFNGNIVKVNASKIGSLYFIDDYPPAFCLEFWGYLSQFFEQTKMNEKT